MRNALADAAIERRRNRLVQLAQAEDDDPNVLKAISDSLAAQGQLPGGAFGTDPLVRDIDPAGLLSGMGRAQAGIRAYHGSPHDFDRFDLSRIGTGEGNQSYGHGLYFAEKEGVARSYRDNLSGDVPANILNRIIHQQGPIREGEALRDVFANMLRAYPSVNKWSKDPRVLDLMLRARRGINADGTYSDDGIRAFRELDNLVGKEQGGRMYEVEIAARPEEFLDWDKPLSEQGPEARRRIEAAGFTAPAERLWVNDLDNQAMRMGEWSGRADLQRTVAGRLRSVGVPGIKYLDQGSRQSGEGSRNYVVFDDRLVRILRKYGIVAVPGAAGAMTVLGVGGGDAQAGTQLVPVDGNPFKVRYRTGQTF